MKKKTLELSENQFRILDLFTKGFDKSYYVRQVGVLLDIGPRTAQLNLEALEQRGVLESEIKGKIKTYILRKNAITKEYLKFAEIFKSIRFLEKDETIREIIGKLSYFIDGIGIVFGSYAKGSQKPDSDIDIFVIGSYNQEEVEKLSKLYSIAIGVKNYPLTLFKKEVTKDFLIKEMLNNHIVFQGVEEFVKLIYGK